jgi:lysophospholipid acyltransferase (LPLAT)-like uncharacterized protein|tara:strand:- start:4 stop:636 length:633 start_codon:yes stop_codon:yes gene_type:complete
MLKIKVSLASILLKSIYSSNKYDVRGRDNYLDTIKKNQSVIISVWHGQLLSILYDLRNENVNAVAGTHADAELISRIAISWGWNMIRGSSKEQGDIAYKSMIRCLQNSGTILFITPDGPTGPPKIPKLGIIRAAQATQSAIIPTSVFSSRRWGFTNWDTFYLEKPFGKIYIEYGKPILFDKNSDQKYCRKVLVEKMKHVETNNLHYTSNG